MIPALQRFTVKYLGMNFGTPNWEILRLVDMQTTFWLQVLTIFAGFILALYAGHRTSRRFHSDRKAAFHAVMPLLILVVVFMILNVYVLGLPMSPRHAH